MKTSRYGLIILLPEHLNPAFEIIFFAKNAFLDTSDGEVSAAAVPWGIARPPPIGHKIWGIPPMGSAKELRFPLMSQIFRGAFAGVFLRHSCAMAHENFNWRMKILEFAQWRKRIFISYENFHY